MLTAWRELRYHPSRFAAVLAAIILSVGFLAATQTFVKTETTAVGLRDAAWTKKADLVASVDLKYPEVSSDETYVGNPNVAKAVQLLGAISGVEHVAPVASGFTTVAGPDGSDVALQYTQVPAEPSLRWMKVPEGTDPTKAGEIAIPSSLAKKLKVSIGSTLKLQSREKPVTLVGLTHEKTVFVTPVLLGPGTLPPGSNGVQEFMITVNEPGQLDSLKASIAKSLKPLSNTEKGATVLTGAERRGKMLKKMGQDTDVVSNMLAVFGAIALLVGAIIIATTFAILVAQRRRQIGLLRAVGATRGQVFRRFLNESLLIGLIGSLAGIAFGIGLSAAASGLVTGSLVYGLDVPWGRLAVILVLGVLVTFIASMFPLRRAMSVLPLEALRPADDTRTRRRGGLLRALICSLLLLAGAGLAVLSKMQPSGEQGLATALLFAIGGSTLITLGVLGAARLYIPPLLGLIGAVVARFGATPRIAALNSRRNPERAGSTAVSLMLAIGLIMTLLVAQGSLRQSGVTELDTKYPVELQIQVNEPKDVLTAKDLAVVKAEPHISAATLVPIAAVVSQINGGTTQSRVMRYDEAFAATLAVPEKLADNEIGISSDELTVMRIKPGTTIPLRSDLDKGPQKQMTIRASNVASFGTWIVTGPTFDAVKGTADNPVIVAQLSQDDQALNVSKHLTAQLQGSHPSIRVMGGAVQKALFMQVLDTLLYVVLALLGVATLIALLGVGNTLGLSVLERTRESALMRALGLQAASLRLMLLVEALMLALASTIVGFGFGLFFGWLGSSVVVNGMGFKHYQLAFDGRIAAGLIALSLAAAALGSIAPGRKAAKAAPVEALADIG